MTLGLAELVVGVEGVLGLLYWPGLYRLGTFPGRQGRAMPPCTCVSYYSHQQLVTPAAVAAAGRKQYEYY